MVHIPWCVCSAFLVVNGARRTETEEKEEVSEIHENLTNQSVIKLN